MIRNYQIHHFKAGFGDFFNNNNYIIVDNETKQMAVVDPSWDSQRIEHIIKEQGLTFTMILLTHSHFDHVNLVNRLLKKYNSQVYMSSAEIMFYNFNCKNLNPVKNNDVIMLGGTEIKCLFTPGHTAGSICYLLSDSIFTGDTIFPEGCGACNNFGGDPGKMFDSIQKIKKIVNPSVNVYPGHSYREKTGLPLDHLLKKNIYFITNNKETFIKYRNRNTWLRMNKSPIWVSRIRRFLITSFREVLYLFYR